MRQRIIDATAVSKDVARKVSPEAMAAKLEAALPALIPSVYVHQVAGGHEVDTIVYFDRQALEGSGIDEQAVREAEESGQWNSPDGGESLIFAAVVL